MLMDVNRLIIKIMVIIELRIFVYNDFKEIKNGFIRIKNKNKDTYLSAIVTVVGRIDTASAFMTRQRKQKFQLRISKAFFFLFLENGFHCRMHAAWSS